jgi:penicillin-binding protein 1A
MSTVAGASKARARTGVAKPSKLRRRIKIALWSIGIGVSLFAILFAIVFIPRLNEAQSKIPNLPMIMEQVNSQPSVIVSDDGETLYSMQGQYRRPVSIEDVPQVVINATLAAEDKRFYEHDGVDFKVMTNIAVQTMLSGDVPRGGSTLTMQIAKRVYTSPVQTLDRKLDDMALAMVIERSLSKDQILQLYLNQVYYGRRAYGIGAAADVYFGKKDLKDLTLGETAMLARLVRRPSHENPFDNLEKAIENRDVVLRLMLGEGMITKKEYEDAKKEKPKLAKAKPQTVSGRKLAPFFVDTILREMERDFPNIDLKMGGYRIETTLNWELQEYAEEQVSKQVKDMRGQRVTTGAMFLMDQDGAVIVHVGGADYEKNQFDVITQGSRQPGSSFKPIMYATAFEKHVVNPGTQLVNGGYSWDAGGGRMVQVRNYDRKYENELMSVERGIILSQNVIAARVMALTGPTNVVSTAKNAFGYTSNLAPVQALCLGATAVSPLEQARAYSVFKTGGSRIEPYFIRRVIAPNGEVVKRYSSRIVRNVLSSETARTMETILYKAAHSGTGGPVTRQGVYNVRGKTGTTSDWRDAWFCGWTDRFVGVGWVGGEVRVGDRWEYRSMNKVVGGSSAGIFWGKIVKRAQDLLGESKSSFEPYYGTNEILIEPDPESGFEELPPLDPDILPPINEGAGEGSGTRPPSRNQSPPVLDPGRDERTLDIVYVEVCADTGAISSVYCPERVKKPFLEGSQPKGTCPVHKPPR